MTDIMSLVASDEKSFPLEIMGRDPETGEQVPTGVTFQIRDLHNADTRKEQQSVQAVALGRRLRTNEALSDLEAGKLYLATTSNPTVEMLAHCVTGWDWGDKTLGDMDLEFKHKNVLAVLGMDWIADQVRAKVFAITDFTMA